MILGHLSFCLVYYLGLWINVPQCQPLWIILIRSTRIFHPIWRSWQLQRKLEEQKCVLAKPLASQLIVCVSLILLLHHHYPKSVNTCNTLLSFQNTPAFKYVVLEQKLIFLPLCEFWLSKTFSLMLPKYMPLVFNKLLLEYRNSTVLDHCLFKYGKCLPHTYTYWVLSDFIFQ